MTTSSAEPPLSEGDRDAYRWLTGAPDPTAGDEDLLTRLRSAPAQRRAEPLPWSRRPGGSPRTAAQEAAHLGLDLAVPSPGEGRGRAARPGGSTRRAMAGVGPMVYAAREQSADPVVGVLRELLPAARLRDLEPTAAAWQRGGFTAEQVRPWAAALGVHGYAAAVVCAGRGLSPQALEVRLAGSTARQRIRGGESVDSVVSLAAALGVALSEGR